MLILLTISDTTHFAMSSDQNAMLDDWKRPAEALPPPVWSLDDKRLSKSQRIPPTMENTNPPDFVQDAATDCSVVASLAAAMARAQSGHQKVSGNYPSYSNLVPVLYRIGPWQDFETVSDSHNSFSLLACSLTTENFSTLAFRPMENTLFVSTSMAVSAKWSSTIACPYPRPSGFCMSSIATTLLYCGLLFLKRRTSKQEGAMTFQVATQGQICGC